MTLLTTFELATNNDNSILNTCILNDNITLYLRDNRNKFTE
jgi:hypothetical protein